MTDRQPNPYRPLTVKWHICNGLLRLGNLITGPDDDDARYIAAELRTALNALPDDERPEDQ